ncbi:hydantoinase/oxoprolinase family protein [Thermosulfurimonas sp. F29]|uniref:hydantoinase/oxoprolinase family protein n=1 Tax=Thermosulfurimonas sp. F29 TaxID=2867247 RepID=UPI001C831D0E|nr:hydantoinase/oxoprolinase family protein [Thermosulfurimonas sp. F29]MBX6422519.1 hydantoinase/oxoprolinase family protein [Thermosulfurimonas sp. F29]
MRVAVDTGGTFTDFVAEAEGVLLTHKVPSTPEDPSRAILRGLSELAERTGEPVAEVLHGTTVGTNAFLTRRGARVALLTTRGFEDVVFIGRQARPALYDFMVEKPRPVVARSLVLGVRERVLADGTVEVPLTGEELERVRTWVKNRRPEAVAVCFLHAYAFPEHERRVARVLADLGLHISLSSEVRPEFREFERTSTTLLNAYLAPVMGRYVRNLAAALPESRIFIMQSNGGLMPAEAVEARAVTTLLSGPAGGVMGALAVARKVGFERIITLDMGGTSTDVSLCDGAPTYTREYEIEGHPVALPLIDIHTIGAGGGSLAWFDAGGALRVGPQSAGADPGPACYGRGGTRPTVTDAHVLAGRLLPHRFLGGRMPLHPERATRALAETGAPRGLSPEALARAIIEITNTNMETALRRVSLERGYDPREFVLVAFGGAGALHAAELTERLAIPRVLVPRLSGVLSALGILTAEPRFDFTAGLRPSRDPVSREFLAARLAALREKAREEIRRLGFPEGDLSFREFVDLRYRGQSFEITVPFGPDFEEAFHREHERLYGFRLPEKPLEATAVRLSATVCRPVPELPPFRGGEGLRPVEHTGLLVGKGRRLRSPVYLWEELPVEAEFSGPALVVSDFATVYLPPGFRAACDRYGNLHLYRF